MTLYLRTFFLIITHTSLPGCISSRLMQEDPPGHPVGQHVLPSGQGSWHIVHIPASVGPTMGQRGSKSTYKSLLLLFKKAN